MRLGSQVTWHVPELLPPATSDWSLRFLPSDAERLSDRFPGVVLPRSLEGAVLKRRLQYAAGRYCARQALAGLRIDAEVRRGADNLPVWPADVVGSISHTNDVAWAAVARKRDASSVGIDVEQIVSPELALRIHRLACTPAELALTGGALEQRALVTLIFSFKESLYKSVFPLVRQFFGYLDASVTDIDLERGTIQGRLEKTLSSEYLEGTAVTGRFAMSGTHVFTAVYLPRPSAIQSGQTGTTRESSDGGAS